MLKYHTQNIIISSLLVTTLIFLLWLASNSSGALFAIALIAFAFLYLTNYAMMHEAMHCNLHDHQKTNHIVGMVTSWVFPVSFTFIQTAHNVHHTFNRTDHEMFDYYYPSDNLLIKYSQWYSILTGIYPPIIPVGSILMALVPRLFMAGPWQRAKSSSVIFNPKLFTNEVITKIRIDVSLGLLFWSGLFYFLKLDPITVLILYLSAWFNWSTRQYVTHAFTPRDIINGAYNLTVSPLMGAILLNSQWDLVHHQHPEIAWQDLPEYGKKSHPPISYWKQYFKQWRGPRPAFEPEPKLTIEKNNTQNT